MTRQKIQYVLGQPLKAVMSRGRHYLRRMGAYLERASGHRLVNRHIISEFSERTLLLQGRMAARSNPVGRQIKNLSEAEFRVFSQWGEDGIIEWLVAHLPVPNKRFVEFGVGTFREANCRFLMQNRNWKGLVFDCSEANIAAIAGQAMYWMHDLTAKSAFVTVENIDKLITSANFSGPLGILSIDVDGNDYWIWNAISSVQPAIVICEVNSILGDMRPVTVPYDPNFRRFDAHYSGLYFGASIAAIKHLALRKGYTFLGTNLNGINAFFVQNELMHYVGPLLVETRAYPSRHRDSRNRDGQLSFAAGAERLNLIKDMSVIDIVTGETIRLDNIKQLYSSEWMHGIS